MPYLRDIFRRTTKPERASWFIWSVLGLIAFFSQLAEGASWSLGFTIFDTIGGILIFMLSIKYGVGGFQKRDIIALIAAGFGLILWYFTTHAFIALFIVMFIDASATIPTALKAYEDPGSETISTFIIVASAAVLAMFAVGKFNLVLLSYPFYLFVANMAVVLALIMGKSSSLRKVDS